MSDQSSPPENWPAATVAYPPDPPPDPLVAPGYRGWSTRGSELAVVTNVVYAVFLAAAGLLTYPLQVVAYATLRARREPLSTALLVEELRQPSFGGKQ